MSTRPLSPSTVLNAVVLGCLLLAASCATPSPSNPTGTGGTGASCSAGQTSCSGQCKTLASDNQNCGSCGNACGSGRICQNGTCACSSGLFLCGGACVASDAQHCGSSCTVCPSGQVCSNNACLAMCPSGQTMCSGGACVPSSGDGTIAHCGGCNACPTGANACNNGVCGCTGSDMLCGSACVNTNTNMNHCGGCNRPCTGGTCTNGSCVTTTGTGGTGGSAAGSGGTTGAAGSTAGTTGTGGVSGTTGSGGRGGSSAGGTGGSGSGGTPAGYWIFNDTSPSYTWNGCVWTGVDSMVTGSTTAFTMPSSKDFTSQAGTSGPYHVAGKVFSNYDAVALLGFNIAQPAAGASCVYKPVTTGDPPLPAAPLPAGTTGIAINWGRAVGSQFRIQIQGPNGANDANDRWCYNITDSTGPSFAPYAMFNTKCWDGTGTNYPASNLASKPISAIVFLVPGTTAVQNFDFTINGFAAGTSAADAPAGGTVIPVMGTIGGAGSTDLDYQRVKVRGKDGKDYIIQNNNWGNASGSNQTIQYVDNSFTITAETGGSPGNGVPASFPSIYIGNNGDTAGGTFSTKGNDGLPKQISAIGSAMTTAAYNRASGDYNASYDIWVAASAPASMYEDAVSGFVMVWLYKPSGRSPIGSMMTTKTVDGTSYQVWVGPRGSGTNPNRPVVSYVVASTTMSKTFNLKPILADAANYGIPSSWYLTDVFFGFEIWSGSGTNGLSVSNFTCSVQ